MWFLSYVLAQCEPCHAHVANARMADRLGQRLIFPATQS